MTSEIIAICLVNIREENSYVEACKYGRNLAKHAGEKRQMSTVFVSLGQNN